jgi:hypothetical protein
MSLKLAKAQNMFLKTFEKSQNLGQNFQATYVCEKGRVRYVKVFRLCKAL